MAGEKNTHLRALAAGIAAAGVAALAGAIAAHGAGLHVLRGGGLVYTVRDPEGRRVRVLRRGGVFQSATYVGEGGHGDFDPSCLEPVFEYYRAFGRVLAGLPEARRVLVVGGGGCSFPKLIAAERPGARVDAVELDPCVIDTAHCWFYVDEAASIMRDASGDLRLICADGRAFLETAPTGSYDMIALDAFCGARPVAALSDEGAARACWRALAPGGVVAANVVTPGGDAAFLRDVCRAFERVFGRADLLPCEDEVWGADDNYLVVARK